MNRIIRYGQRARNIVLVVSATTALLAVSASADAAEHGARNAAPSWVAPPAGAVGPVVTHPVQQPFDYPAGEVCAFPSHADFPVSDLTLRTWSDRDGKPVFAIESGPLIMRVTNLETGKSVQRDISGTGVITYPDADSYLLSGNDWSAGFHSSDRPVHNRWIVAHDYMSVKISTVGDKTSRTLLALRGSYEDLCSTLS